MSPVPTQKRRGPNFRRFHYTADKWSNRMFYEVMPDGAWKNHPCFIIGGGPSLLGFDWSLLKGYRTIGINRAFEKYDPTIIFSMDTRYLRWITQNKYGIEVKKKYEKSKAYKVWLCTYRAQLPDDVFILKVYRSYTRGFKAFELSMKSGLGHGNNSGYAALNLACCLGANPIYLLGFDMKHVHSKDTGQFDKEMRKEGKNTRTHWHDGHPRPQSPQVLKGFIGHMNTAAAVIRRTKIQVINLNPESALECFPRKPYSEVLH